MASTPSATTSDRFPPQVPYIIGNEACERFSFYGMRNILTVFLIDYLLRNAVPDEGARSAHAKSLMHLFMAGVYFFPLLGGYLADRWLGKYKVILSLSLVYCLGHAFLAHLREQRHGLLHGPVPHRPGQRRHQAVRERHGGRPVQRVQQAPGEEGLRHLLLDHQLRLLLRLAVHPADAQAPGARRGVRHPRHADVHRHRHLLGGPPALRGGAAHRPQPALLPQGDRLGAPPPGARQALARRRHEEAPRRGGGGRQGRAAHQRAASSPPSRSSGCSSTRRPPRGWCRRAPWTRRSAPSPSSRARCSSSTRRW